MRIGGDTCLRKHVTFDKKREVTFVILNGGNVIKEIHVAGTKIEMKEKPTATVVLRSVTEIVLVVKANMELFWPPSSLALTFHTADVTEAGIKQLRYSIPLLLQ